MSIDVSIVVPTRNGAGRLPRTLDALARQTHPVDRYEVVVVANACADDTAALVRGREQPHRLEVIETANPGVGAARNGGAAAARGVVLAFLDDDIEVAPTFVASHAAAHADGADAVAVGALGVPTSVGRETLLLERLRQQLDESQRRLAAAPAWWLFTGGNMSLPTALFSRLGGFDTRLVHYGGEDYEFAYRAQQAGCRLAFTASASGCHYHDAVSMAEYLRRARLAGRHDTVVARWHPGVTDRLPLGRADRPRSLSGQLARVLAFDHPRAGHWLAAALRVSSLALAVGRWRRPWNTLMDALYDYSYYSGVQSEVGDRRAVARLLDVLRSRAVVDD